MDFRFKHGTRSLFREMTELYRYLHEMLFNKDLMYGDSVQIHQIRDVLKHMKLATLFPEILGGYEPNRPLEDEIEFLEIEILIPMHVTRNFKAIIDHENNWKV